MENTKGLSGTTQGQGLGFISCLKDKTCSEILKEAYAW